MLPGLCYIQHILYTNRVNYEIGAPPPRPESFAYCTVWIGAIPKSTIAALAWIRRHFSNRYRQFGKWSTDPKDPAVDA